MKCKSFLADWGAERRMRSNCRVFTCHIGAIVADQLGPGKLRSVPPEWGAFASLAALMSAALHPIYRQVGSGAAAGVTCTSWQKSARVVRLDARCTGLEGESGLAAADGRRIALKLAFAYSTCITGAGSGAAAAGPWVIIGVDGFSGLESCSLSAGANDSLAAAGDGALMQANLCFPARNSTDQLSKFCLKFNSGQWRDIAAVAGGCGALAPPSEVHDRTAVPCRPQT